VPLEALLDERTQANRLFFRTEAERIARLCHRMGERFARGGRLIALGGTPAARSDARHVAVEFVHPVIVGKRALPAIGLSAEGGPLDAQVALLASRDDIVLAFDEDPEAFAALSAAAAAGCLVISLAAEWPPPSEDPFIRQELTETLYHLLWELVHVFLDHRAREAGAGAGAAGFLYPFLEQQQPDVEAVVADVAASVVMKADEVGALREQTLRENREVLEAAARELRARLDAGGTLFALGNGGSATDAMDAVADFRFPPRPWPARRALDLTEDPAIITAIANDIGPEAIFARQVIAYGGARDALLALSTSGNSRSVIAALAEARRRGLLTIACVGYGGGEVAAEGLADHVIVTRSEHIPRIQEAQASAYHVLRELVEA